MESDILRFVLVAIITLIASYIQGATGFGFGIFAMIFLPRILAYTEANVFSSILSSLSSLFIAILMLRKIHWKNIIFPLIGCLASTYIAVSFIKTQSSQTLTLLLGIALFILSMYFFFFTDKIKIKPTWYAGLTAGVVSGIMSGMFAIGGPPVVIYFMQSEEDSEQYVATISTYFVLSGIISVGTKAAAGFITTSVWIALAVGMLGMLLGSLVGKWTRDRINPKMVKKIVYGFMAISGIINVITSLF
jgi:uncharacterized membrane protein YfcA